MILIWISQIQYYFRIGVGEATGKIVQLSRFGGGRKDVTVTIRIASNQHYL